jgi:hypothetical protein
MSFFTPFAFVKQASGGAAGAFIQATGGTITFEENYKIHTFTTSGNFTIQSLGTDPTYGDKVEYMIVGGGGGSNGGGGSPARYSGGGAGGVLRAGTFTASVDTYPAVVGAGGNGTTPPTQNLTGGTGGASSIFGTTATGGNGAASFNGGSNADFTGAGASGGAPNSGAGAGAGANANQRDGGTGASSSITGTSTFYGGGGAAFNGGYGTGGAGGGGGAFAAGTNGLGGGAGFGDGNTGGLRGGDGIVIVKYPYEWAPSLMNGNAYWWRADLGVALSGTTVTSWTDQKVGAVLTGAGTPTFSSAIAGMNNQPGIYFDSSDRLTLNSLANPQESSSDSLVFWAVIDTGTNGLGGYQMVFGAAVGGSGEWVLERNNPSFANSYTNYFFNWLGFATGDKNFGVSVQATEREWVANQYNPNPTGTATANMFRAGVLLSTVTGNAAGGKEATLNLNVGNYSAPDIHPLNGSILEFGINGKALTSADLTNMNAYCLARYGIS